MSNPRISKKESGLIKGALRRVFSRSDLRRAVLEATVVVYSDATRARVKRWSRCEVCAQLVPTYLIEVDHKLPIIGLSETLEDLTWDQVVDRIWCERENLQGICEPCHKQKSKDEAKIRAANRKAKKAKNK